MPISIDNIAKSFYTAFQQSNAAQMNALYHPELQFEDPAFGKLDYHRTAYMWQMLCENAKDLKITFTVISENEDEIITQWVAYYTFSATKRAVKNIILAQMRIKDGLIIEHRDSFNLHKWAQQALGFKGWLIGGTAFFRKQLQQKTRHQLDKYIARKK